MVLGLSLLLLVGVASCASERTNVAPPVVTSTLAERYATDSTGRLGELVDADWIGDSAIILVAEGGKSMQWIDARGRGHNVGHTGDGPGEFRGITSVTRYHASNAEPQFVSLDAALRRVSFWNSNGQFLRDVSLRAAYASGLWATDSGVLVRTLPANRGSAELYRVDVAAGDPRFVRRYEFGFDPLKSMCMYCRMALAFDLSAVSLIAHDTLYRLLRFDATGKPISALERSGVPLVPRSDAERDSIVEFRERLINSGTSELIRRSLREAVRRTPISTFKYRFSGVTLDSDGRVFVQRQTHAGDPSEVDVFDQSGAFMFTVHLPTGTRLVRVRERQLLVFRFAENGDQFVESYVTTDVSNDRR